MGFILSSFLSWKISKFTYFLKAGLSTLRVKAGLYFFHFYFIRLILTILYAVSSESSAALWGVLVGIQTLCLLLHLPKMFQAWGVYLMSLVRETTILFVFLFILVLHFADQSTERQKFKALIVFSVFYISLSLVQVFIGLGRIGLTLYKKIRKCRQNRI